MSDIFVEVDEALKQERLENIWKKHGGLFVSVLLAIILGTAANAGYKHWNKSANIKQTDILLSATDDTDYNADDLLNITPSLKGGLNDIVKIQAAGLLTKTGSNDQSLKIYNEIADDKSANKEIQQLAKYLSVNLNKSEDKLNQLNQILSDNNNPWQNHALLDSAVLEANINNDYKKSRIYLATILKKQDVAETLKQKAQSLDILYSLKAKIQTTNNED